MGSRKVRLAAGDGQMQRTSVSSSAERGSRRPSCFTAAVGPCLAQRELPGNARRVPSPRRWARPGCGGSSDPARPPSGSPSSVPLLGTHCTRLQGDPGAWAVTSTVRL